MRLRPEPDFRWQVTAALTVPTIRVSQFGKPARALGKPTPGRASDPAGSRARPARDAEHTVTQCVLSLAPSQYSGH